MHICLLHGLKATTKLEIMQNTNTIVLKDHAAFYDFPFQRYGSLDFPLKILPGLPTAN